MPLEYASELRRVTEQIAAELLLISPDVAATRPAPDKWSIKEIVGHLIDSASNNHQRFVRAQWSSDLICPGYEQDAWVLSQDYLRAPWAGLVRLWREFNLHLAWLMEAISTEDRERKRHPHNLDLVAFRPVAADEPVTLDYFMSDYVEHLKHHLRQVQDLRGAGA